MNLWNGKWDRSIDAGAVALCCAVLVSKTSGGERLGWLIVAVLWAAVAACRCVRTWAES